VARRTIRTRITATALGVVGTALVVSAAALLALQHHHLRANVDDQARSRLQDVAALVQRGDMPTTLAGEDDGTVAQVVADGRVLAQSPIIHASAPLTAAVPIGAGIVLQTVERPPIGDDDSSYRVASTAVATPTGPVIVYAAASLEPVIDSRYTLAVILCIVVPVLFLLVGITTWELVGSTLEPVEAIRRQVAEISATALDRRVPEPATADEIDRLARTMNVMLDRLDAAARRQRAFVADASHELRSPLATIRTKLEVGLARSTAVDWPGLARGWLAEQERLERLVDDLLLLARMDEGAADNAPSLVDLDELLLREARDLQSRGKVRVELAKIAGARVRGDGERLRRVVSNLLDNAERHACTTVRCELGLRDGTVELVVSDDGPGVARIERERIFERFVRLDESRTRRGGVVGLGLGLAIVQDIVTAHGGTVEAAGTTHGARFVVRLPATDTTFRLDGTERRAGRITST
jgi:signal transduction histidine kinase